MSLLHRDALGESATGERARPKSLIARFCGDRERGAGTVEYAGIAVVVAVVIGGLVAVPWMPQVTKGVQTTICTVLSKAPGGGGGTCAGVVAPPMSPEDYIPTCLVSDTSMTRGSKAKIMMVDLGSNVKLQVRTYSDGRTEVTMLKDFSGGAAADLGKIKLGKGAEIKLGANGKVTYGNGSTWVFDNPGDADALVKEITDTANSGWNYVPFVGPMFVDTPPDPRITYDSLDLSVGGTVGLKLPPFQGKDPKGKNPGSSSGDSGSPSGQKKPNELNVPTDKPSLDLGADAKFSEQGIIRHDRGENMDSPDDDTTTYVLQLEAGASARAGVDEARAGANANANGQVAITTDSDGKITQVQFVTTRNADADTGDNYDDKNPTIDTTTVKVETDDQRKVVQDWLQNPTNVSPYTLIAGGPKPTENGDLSPFEQLIHDRAVMKEEKFTGDFENRDWGIGGRILDIGLGWDRTDQDQTLTNSESAYWGMPDANGVRHKTDNPNC